MCASIPAGMSYAVLETVLCRQVTGSARTTPVDDCVEEPDPDHSIPDQQSTPASALISQHPSDSTGLGVEQRRPAQWERSIVQTAILLRQATLSPREYAESGSTGNASLSPMLVAQLQCEFIRGMIADMARRDAAGKPMEFAQFMELVEPLLYR